ncbi:MAG: hypothetical protein KC587_11880, partial [Nitrospira sp.]|nr:hypothetical protein [Nitrospira sp.]
MNRTVPLALLLFTSSLALMCGRVRADELLKPRAELNLRPGTDRSLLMTDFWVPLKQDLVNSTVLYSDFRLMRDNRQNQEFNLGIGFRKTLNKELLGHGIGGAHLWYDRKHSSLGTDFNQLAAGIEWFGDYDLKLNAYLPLNTQKTHINANPAGTDARFSGNSVVLNTNQKSIEEALRGIDFEIGTPLEFLSEKTDSTRLYGGLYYFHGQQVKDITGARVRLTSDINGDVSLGGRFQYDPIRGSQGLLDLTLRFPFGNKREYKKYGIKARLDETPERDVDVVTNQALTDEGMNKILLNKTTGQEQAFIHVDNTNGAAGDGTAENPFNTLSSAASAAGSNDVIYVHQGDGTSTGQNSGILLDDTGLILAGSGSHFHYNDGPFTTENKLGVSTPVLFSATDAPVIGNSAGDGVTITAGGIRVQGITVQGSSDDNIYIKGAEKV